MYKVHTVGNRAYSDFCILQNIETTQGSKSHWFSWESMVLAYWCWAFRGLHRGSKTCRKLFRCNPYSVFRPYVSSRTAQPQTNVKHICEWGIELFPHFINNKCRNWTEFRVFIMQLRSVWRFTLHSSFACCLLQIGAVRFKIRNRQKLFWMSKSVAVKKKKKEEERSASLFVDCDQYKICYFSLSEAFTGVYVWKSP